MSAISARDRRAAARSATLVAVVLLPFVLTGCRAARPHAATQPAVPTGTNAELIEYISDQPFVAAEPAYRAVYILSKGEVYEGGFDELSAEMVGARLVSGAWNYDSTTYLDRAAIGYMVARACNIHTGLNWSLTGLGRYAYRELAYRRIAHPAGELSLISGGEFVGLLARAEEYLHKTGRGAGEAAELGAEPAK